MTKLGFRPKARTLKYEVVLLHRCVVKPREDAFNASQVDDNSLENVKK